MANKEEVEIRRAPKFLPFLLTGGALGLVLALVLFFVAPHSEDWAQLLGTLVVFMSALGAFGGLYLAVIFDRISRAKAKRTSATKLEG